VQIGILLSVEGFGKEIAVLGGLADFVEVLLTGKQDASSLLESRHRLLAHLAELDSECFESLEQAKLLHVDKATIHFFTRSRVSFDEKMRILGKLLEKAAEYGIIICLENTEESVNTLKSIFNRMPRLRFCLDVGHANLFSNNPVDFISAFSNRLDHIHISDNYGGDSEDDDLHLPPGDGTINFQHVFSKLKAINYDKTMTLELHPRFDVNIKAKSLHHLKSWNKLVP